MQRKMCDTIQSPYQMPYTCRNVANSVKFFKDIIISISRRNIKLWNFLIQQKKQETVRVKLHIPASNQPG